MLDTKIFRAVVIYSLFLNEVCFWSWPVVGHTGIYKQLLRFRSFPVTLNFYL